MMTDTHTDTATQLLRNLIEALIDYDRDLVLEVRPINRDDGRHWRTDFIVTPNINDAGKIIGKLGAHVKALKRVMELVGEQHGRRYVLRVEAGTGDKQPEIRRELAGPEYRCDERQELLMDALREAGVEAKVVVSMSPGSVLGYVFTVMPANHLANARLVEVDDAIPGPSLSDALAVLFKAAGHRDGVVFRVEVHQ